MIGSVWHITLVTIGDITRNIAISLVVRSFEHTHSEPTFRCFFFFFLFFILNTITYNYLQLLTLQNKKRKKKKKKNNIQYSAATIKTIHINT